MASSISSFTPTSAKFGDELRIRGTDLYPVSFVSIGGVMARVTYNSSDEIWVRVPNLNTDANQVSADIRGTIVAAPTALRRSDRSTLGVGGALGLGYGAGGAFGGAAASGVTASVGQGRQAYGTASGFTGAVAGAGGQVLGAGANLATTALSAGLSPLGATGQGLAGIGGAVLNTGASFLSSGLQIGGTLAAAGASGLMTAAMLPLNIGGAALQAGGSLLSGVGGVVSGLGGATFGVASVAGGALGIGGSILGGLGSLVGTATGAVTKIFETILQGAQNVVKVVGDGLGKLGELAGSVLSGILTVGQDIISEARNYGRNIRSIGFQTGIGEGAAGRMANSFAFAGVSPQSLSSAFSSPQATLSIGVRAAILGLPDPTKDPTGFLLGGARAMQGARQGGLIGAMQFNALAGPQITGAFGSAFDLGPERLQRNMNLAESFKLPGNMGEFSRDLDAFSIAVEALGRNLKLTLAEVLVPLMPQLNAGFSTIIQNKDAIIGAVKQVGNWVVGELPQYILHGGAAILRVTSTVFDKVGSYFTDGFQKFLTGAIQNLPSTLQALDQFLAGMRNLAAAGIGMGAALGQVAFDLWNNSTVQNILNALSAANGGGSPTNNNGATGAQGGTTSGNAPSPNMNPGSSVFPPTTNNASAGAMPPGIPPGTTTYSANVPNPNARIPKPTYGQLARGYASAGVGAAGGLLVDLARVARTVAIDLPEAYANGGWAGFSKAYGAADRHAFDWTVKGAQAGFTWGSGGFDPDPAKQVQKWRAQQAQAAQQAQQQQQAAQGGIGNVGMLMPHAGQTPAQAFQNAQQWFLNTAPQVNVSSQQQNIADVLKAIQSGSNDLGGWMKDKAPGMANDADTLDRWGDQWKERLVNAAERSADSNEAIAHHGDRNVQATMDLIRLLRSSILPRTAAYIAEDVVGNALRVR